MLAMLRDRFWVDHRSRIDFYVKNGLLGRAPSDGQLRRAFAEYGSGGGVLERISRYLRNPRLLFPSRAKGRVLEQSIAEIVEKGYVPAAVLAKQPNRPARETAEDLPLDRFLHSLFLFAPVRFACSNASLMILSLPCDVVTVKSMARSSVTFTPSLPNA